MERTVEYNGYLYTTNNMSCEEVTEAEALRNAIELSNFLSDAKTWNEEDINELFGKRNTLGLTKSVKSQLYDAYFDICYYGSTDKASFMQMFNLSDEQLGGILL